MPVATSYVLHGRLVLSVDSEVEGLRFEDSCSVVVRLAWDAPVANPWSWLAA